MESSSLIAAHDPEQMRAILQRHSQAPERVSFRVPECRITRTRRRDGLRGATQYERSIAGELDRLHEARQFLPSARPDQADDVSAMLE